MTEREIIRTLLDIIVNQGIVALRLFAKKQAERLGIPLPPNWIPRAVMEEMEKAADEAGWPR